MRSRLKVRHEPYYRQIEPGLFVGYRKLASGPGTWVVRRYNGQAYTKSVLRNASGHLIIADDFSDADGKTVLSFAQAQEHAKARPIAPASGYTVNDAMADYMTWLEASGKPTKDALYRNGADIAPAFGNVPVANLTPRRYENGLPSSQSNRRGCERKKAKSSGTRKLATMRSSKRRGMATANRTWTVFKAALNRAWKERKGAIELAWRRVTIRRC